MCYTHYCLWLRTRDEGVPFSAWIGVISRFSPLVSHFSLIDTTPSAVHGERAYSSCCGCILDWNCCMLREPGEKKHENRFSALFLSLSRALSLLLCKSLTVFLFLLSLMLVWCCYVLFVVWKLCVWLSYARSTNITLPFLCFSICCWMACEGATLSLSTTVCKHSVSPGSFIISLHRDVLPFLRDTTCVFLFERESCVWQGCCCSSTMYHALTTRSCICYHSEG